MLHAALVLLLTSISFAQVDLSLLAPEASVAIAKQQKITTTNATNSTEWFTLGTLYHAHGLEDAAIETYKQSLAIKSTDKTLYLLGVAYARMGDYETAIKTVAGIENYLPAIWQQGYWNLDLGEFATATSLFKTAIQKDPTCVPAIVGLVRVYLASNQSAKAIPLLEDIISRGGLHPYISFLLGTAHRRVGNDELASQLLSAKTIGPPVWNDKWYLEMTALSKGYAAELGRSAKLIDAGNLTGARTVLQSLSIRYPKDATVLNNLATVFLQLGQLQQATETLQKAIRWEPRHAPSQLTMGYVMQSSNKLDLALAYAKKAIEFQPGMSAAYAFAGRVCFQTNSMATASFYFAKAIELGNSDFVIREMLGMVLLNTGQPDKALEQFDLVLKVSPNNTGSISGKSIAMALLGNANGALEILAKAKVAFPNDPRISRAWQSVLKIRESQ
ncbi:MAG TPA: tetratricopeptide repeat protein [Phycisphaerales bacterium]|nr:tetratricopeptide repeat protein [Phycisphaerales bacterium]HIB49853.1 tetratricopeptide repeat protein [Phycisphaerales bacterium]HIN84315.1 tetratricopeptide repeat protein [Phycisphaerales bacterium]